MSKTNKFKPRPYFNPEVLDDLENEDAAAKNPENVSTKEDSDHDGRRDTRDNVDASATSENESTYEKRWKDLKKHYDSEVSTLRRKIRELEDNEGSNPPFTPPKTPEDLQKFREQYPEFYDVILSVAHQQANGLVETSSSRIRELEEKLAMTEREKALKLIENAHPDYVPVVNSNDFQEWLEQQTSAIQQWVKENSTDHAAFIRALDLYKLDKGLTTTRKGSSKKEDTKANTFATNSSAAMEVSTKNNSVTVGESGKRIWSRAEIDRMHPTEFEKHEDEITEAMLEGRVQ